MSKLTTGPLPMRVTITPHPALPGQVWEIPVVNIASFQFDCRYMTYGDAARKWGYRVLEEEVDVGIDTRAEDDNRLNWPRQKEIDLKNPRTFEDHLDKVFEEAKQLLLRKHHDYGPHNIGNSPGGPLNGLRVRIWDKVARINNLTDRDDAPKNESLRDSYVDLVNYGAIALVVMDGNWPDE